MVARAASDSRCAGPPPSRRPVWIPSGSDSSPVTCVSYCVDRRCRESVIAFAFISAKLHAWPSRRRLCSFRISASPRAPRSTRRATRHHHVQDALAAGEDGHRRPGLSLRGVYSPGADRHARARRRRRQREPLERGEVAQRVVERRHEARRVRGRRLKILGVVLVGATDGGFGKYVLAAGIGSLVVGFGRLSTAKSRRTAGRPSPRSGPRRMRRGRRGGPAIRFAPS